MIKLGDSGEKVKDIQLALGIKADGYFGIETHEAVIKFQKLHNLVPDGIVGQITHSALFLNADTDLRNVKFQKYYLSDGRYVLDAVTGKSKWQPNFYNGQTNPKWVFLHHTAGGANPFQTVDIWEKDDKAVATNYVVGGISTNGNSEHDGIVVECLKKGQWGAHLTIGGTEVHRESIGIEICSFGGLTKKGDKYFNAYGWEVPQKYVCDLGWTYRFNRYFHKYSEAQIEAVKDILLTLKYEGIDINSGLKKLIKEKGIEKAFEFIPDYITKNHGIYTHSNIFNGKNDIFPQPEMVEMILSL